MNVKAIIGALTGGIVGAALGVLLWGTKVVLADITIRMLPLSVPALILGIGILVGGGSAMLGGKGFLNGLYCACLAAAAALLGQMFWVQVSDTYAQRFLEAQIEEQPSMATLDLSRDAYLQSVRNAKDFARVPSEADYASFMTSHGYAEGTDPSRVSAEDYRAFMQFEVPKLRNLMEEKPSYEEWRDDLRASRSHALDRGSVANLHLTFLDVITLFGAVIVSFLVGSGHGIMPD